MQIEKKRNSITEKRLALKQRREQILALDPPEALAAILDTPQPAPLVHSFAAEDLHLLVQEIGPEDALPLLALASTSQWEYVLDTIAWRRDRLHQTELTHWMHHLFKADPNRLVRWFLTDKTDLVELYLHGNIEVVVREYDQSPSDLGEGFVSDDEVYYWCLRPLPEAVTKAFPELTERRDALVGELLKRLSSEDHVAYQQLLLESAALIPAEAEEEAFRLRSVRLAERGFLPFSEAVGVYQLLTPGELLDKGTKILHQEADFTTALPIPQVSVPPRDGSRFARALAGVRSPTVLLQLQAEFAHLCNQVIVADQVVVSERSVLSTVVTKVSGYLGIALERIREEADGDSQVPADAELIQRYRLADLFRVGFGAAQALKWRCERWHRESWYRDNGLPLSFWEEAGVGVLGGLLIKRPLYFDNYHSGVLYREFQTLAEIRQTEAALNALIALDNLLSLLAIEIEQRLDERLFSYRSLLLTSWAQSVLTVEGNDTVLRYAPIEVGRFIPFYKKLWAPDTHPPRVDEKARRRFVVWLAVHSHLTETEILAVLEPEFERLFSDIAEELGPVSARDLDPRFVTLFTLDNA